MTLLLTLALLVTSSLSPAVMQRLRHAYWHNHQPGMESAAENLGARGISTLLTPASSRRDQRLGIAIAPLVDDAYVLLPRLTEFAQTRDEFLAFQAARAARDIAIALDPYRAELFEITDPFLLANQKSWTNLAFTQGAPADLRVVALETAIALSSAIKLTGAGRQWDALARDPDSEVATAAAECLGQAPQTNKQADAAPPKRAKKIRARKSARRRARPSR